MLRVGIIARYMTHGFSDTIKAMEIKNFLKRKGYEVKMILTEGIAPSYGPLRVMYVKDPLSYWKEVAKKVERKISENHFDVLIAELTSQAYVFTKNFDHLRILDCHTPLVDELYFSHRYKLEYLQKLREVELKIYENSDYVLFPWETYENYVRKYVYNGSNLTTVRWGCHPSKYLAKYAFLPSIVFLGSLKYWANLPLLSKIYQRSYNIIDFYGGPPQEEYRNKVNYKGYIERGKLAKTLSKYQFGLTCVTKDILRRMGHSSKVHEYLSCGLPVLSPEWHEWCRNLKGVIQYNEDNFQEIVDLYSDKTAWEKLSKEAYSQAKELDWNNTLKDLEKLISINV